MYDHTDHWNPCASHYHCLVYSKCHSSLVPNFRTASQAVAPQHCARWSLQICYHSDYPKMTPSSEVYLSHCEYRDRRPDRCLLENPSHWNALDTVNLSTMNFLYPIDCCRPRGNHKNCLEFQFTKISMIFSVDRQILWIFTCMSWWNVQVSLVIITTLVGIALIIIPRLRWWIVIAFRWVIIETFLCIGCTNAIILRRSKFKEKFN